MGLAEDTTLDLALICIPSALVGARLYYVAFSWEMFAAKPLDIFAIWSGGMAIYGGIIGGVIAGWIYSRAKKAPFWRLADLAAPSIALGQAVGRWGNFFNREAFGDAVTNPSMQFFPLAVYIERLGGWHYATFFYESMWCFAVVAALLILERKGFFRRQGDVFLWYALLYAAERAVVEGLRSDSLYIGDIRVSQALSLLVLVGICISFALRLRKVRPAACATAILFTILLAILPFAGILEASVPTLLWICALITAICFAVYAFLPRAENPI